MTAPLITSANVPRTDHTTDSRKKATVSDDADFVTGFDLRVDGGALATWGARSKFDAQRPAR